MKIKYANEFIQNMGLSDPTIFFYQLIIGENESNDTNIIQYFIVYRLLVCIRLNSFVAHMLYEWPFSHNTAVPIAIKNYKYYLSLNTYTNMFACGAINSNKNRT